MKRKTNQLSRHLYCLFFALVTLSSGVAYASDFNFVFNRDIEESNFESLAQDLVTGSRYRFFASDSQPAIAFGFRHSNSQLSNRSKKIISDSSSHEPIDSLAKSDFSVQIRDFSVSYSALGIEASSQWGFGFQNQLSLKLIDLHFAIGYSYLKIQETFCAPSLVLEGLAGMPLGIFYPYLGLGMSQHRANYNPKSSLGYESHSSSWRDYFASAGVSLSIAKVMSVGLETKLSGKEKSMAFFGQLSL